MAHVPPLPSPQLVEQRATRLRSELWVAIGLSVVLVALNVLLERSAWAESLRALTYRQALGRLSPANDGVKVAVLDISAVPRSTGSEILSLAPSQTSPTSRSELKKMLDAVSAAGAAAIGVDIDFSPTPDGYAVADDPAFFRHVLSLGVPTRLGVYRTQAGPAAYVLGARVFAPLGASMLIPSDTSRLFGTVAVSDPSSGSVPTLAASLADAYRADKARQVQHWFPEWALEQQFPLEEANDVNGSGFYVDYRALDAIRLNTFPATSVDTIRDLGDRLRGKVVLIGDVEHAQDRFTVPGTFDTQPGILFHGAAVYTLVQAPLFVLRLPARIVLDVLVTGIVLGFVFGIRFYCNKRFAWDVATFNVFAAASVVAIFTMYELGLGLVGWTRIIWDDFAVVAIALAIHIIIDAFREHLWPTLRKVLEIIGRAIAFGPRSNP